jgi:hypothetical protein
MLSSLISLFLVIAFRKDVIIQVLIGAIAPTPFEAASGRFFFYLTTSIKINIINADGEISFYATDVIDKSFLRPLGTAEGGNNERI